jgi:hypothetical protein
MTYKHTAEEEREETVKKTYAKRRSQSQGEEASSNASASVDLVSQSFFGWIFASLHSSSCSFHLPGFSDLSWQLFIFILFSVLTAEEEATRSQRKYLNKSFG